MKKRLILNEIKHVENIISDKLYRLDVSYVYSDLSIMANYYYQVLQYRRPKIKEILKDYASKHYDRYDDRTAAMIDKIVDKAGKYKMLEYNSICVTKNEMQTIKALDDKTLEKLAFTLLCVAKYQKLKNPDFAGWCNMTEQELMTLAKIKNSKSKNYEDITVGTIYLGRLYQAGLIKFNHHHSSDNTQVLFIDNDSEPELTITNLDDLGYQYLLYKNQNKKKIGFFKCSGCDKLIKNYGDNMIKQYCPSCLLRMNVKIGACIDCGKVYTNGKFAGSRNVRCPDCQKIRNRQKVKEWKEKQKKIRIVSVSNINPQ